MLVPIICVLLGLGVGFFGGYKYRIFVQRKNLTNGQFGMMGGPNWHRFFRNGNGGQGIGMMFRGGVFGSILSIDSNGVTVKLNDGSSKIVLFSSATTYTNTTSASKNDLKVGESVAIFGATNSDGSVTATDVQINPEFGRVQPSPTPATR